MDTDKTITLGSLFDGIGGFPYASAFYGIKPVWASEILPQAISVTRRHFPHMKHVGDITSLDGAVLAPVDIITFGSPCQDLSIAGRRAGLTGARSGLFTEAVRIIDEMRRKTDGRYPSFAVWENVFGALSSTGGRDFAAVLAAFAKTTVPVPVSGRWAYAGMVRGDGVDIAWRVLDACLWGVPQRRRRIFLVADFRGRRASEVLFVEKSLRGHLAPGGQAQKRVAADASRGAFGAVQNDMRAPVGGFGHAPVAAAFSGGAASPAGARGDSSPCADRGQNVVALSPPAITMRLREGCEGGGKGPLLQKEKSGALATHSDQYLFAPTPIATGRKGQAHASYIVRRLTPTECERLQGFPDGWTRLGAADEEISDTRRYQMLGNSLAIPCVAFVLGNIAAQMGPRREETASTASRSSRPHT
jgi:DNA (cytosine-5)-methyltransferase 1